MTGQRDPRARDDAFLRFVRQQPCCICGRAAPNEACHIRAASPENGKRSTGLQEKPSDRWCVPMCPEHHREQHSQNEIQFWRKHGLDPFVIAARLYATFGGTGGTTAKPKRKERPKPNRKAKIVSRTEWPKGRKINSRGWRE